MWIAFENCFEFFMTNTFSAWNIIWNLPNCHYVNLIKVCLKEVEFLQWNRKIWHSRAAISIGTEDFCHDRRSLKFYSKRKFSKSILSILSWPNFLKVEELPNSKIRSRDVGKRKTKNHRICCVCWLNWDPLTYEKFNSMNSITSFVLTDLSKPTGFTFLTKTSESLLKKGKSGFWAHAFENKIFSAHPHSKND